MAEHTNLIKMAADYRNRVAELERVILLADERERRLTEERRTLMELLGWLCPLLLPDSPNTRAWAVNQDAPVTDAQWEAQRNAALARLRGSKER